MIIGPEVDQTPVVVGRTQEAADQNLGHHGDRVLGGRLDHLGRPSSESCHQACRASGG